MRVLLLLAALSASSCIKDAYAGDFIYSCPVLGGDAGNTIKVTTVKPNSQFMVSTNYQVNYRECTSTTCTATSTDAPIPANQQVDLCMRSGYNTVSFYKLYDGGNPSVCIYEVTPKTVCQINSP